MRKSRGKSAWRCVPCGIPRLPAPIVVPQSCSAEYGPTLASGLRGRCGSARLCGLRAIGSAVCLGRACLTTRQWSGSDVERLLIRIASRLKIVSPRDCHALAGFAHSYLADRHQRRTQKHQTRPALAHKWIRLTATRVSAALHGEAVPAISTGDAEFRRVHERAILGLFSRGVGRPPR